MKYSTTFRSVVACLVTSLASCVTTVAQVAPTSRADAICVATIERVSAGLQSRVWYPDHSHADRLVPVVRLHLRVEGDLVGKVPGEVDVLASEANLRFHGYSHKTVQAESNEINSPVVHSPGSLARLGRAADTVELQGLRAIFQLQSKQPQGAFLYSEGDRFALAGHDPFHSANLVDDPAQYALSGFSDKGIDAITPTSLRSGVNNSLPAGLRLLDFMADEALAGGMTHGGRLAALRLWNPSLKQNRFGGIPTLLDGISRGQIVSWFSSRFSDSVLTPSQQGDYDLLCLRSEWGDDAAYQRFRAIAMKTGRPSTYLWLPTRKTPDPELWLNLAERATEPEQAKELFLMLRNAPAAKAKTLALARKLIGRNQIVDTGILECLFALTRDQSLNPSDDRGLRSDLSEQRTAASRMIEHELARRNVDPHPIQR